MSQRNRERKPRASQGEDVRQVTLVKTRDILGELANRVEFGSERIIVTRRGKAAFALVSMKDYAALEGAA